MVPFVEEEERLGEEGSDVGESKARASSASVSSRDARVEAKPEP